MLNTRKYRRKSGLTQAKLAEMLGVCSNAVSQWETGTRSPSVRHIMHIAKLLGCTVDDLLKCNDEG